MIAIALLLIVPGCGNDKATDELLPVAKIAVAAELKDPDSAKFRRLASYPDRGLVCGQVNGKNSYGAYSGFTDFYYNNGIVIFADEESPLRDGLDELCLGAMKQQADDALARARSTWEDMPDSEEKREALSEITALEQDRESN